MQEIIELPVYWHGSVDAVNEDLKKVKKGTVKELRPSAGGRPIYMVEYGKNTLPKSLASLSSALGARDYNCYADKTGADYVPTVFLAGCIHGGEFEGTVGIMNLISLLETGVDLAGKPNDALLSVAEKLHLILMPMCNPDGRSHIPFDNFVGHTFEDLRYYNQGAWKNGELCGWPGCKTRHPIKEYVSYLGGYFNDDGVNMMHDDYFVNPCNEVKNVLEVTRDYAPDFSVLFHGGDNSRNHFFPVSYITAEARRQMTEVANLTTEAFAKEGFIFTISEAFAKSGGEDTGLPPFTLTSAMFNTCGEPCVTYESNQGLIKPNSYCLNNDEIYRCHMLFMEVALRWTLDNKSAAARAAKSNK